MSREEVIAIINRLIRTCLAPEDTEANVVEITLSAGIRTLPLMHAVEDIKVNTSSTGRDLSACFFKEEKKLVAAPA